MNEVMTVTIEQMSPTIYPRTPSHPLAPSQLHAGLKLALMVCQKKKKKLYKFTLHVCSWIGQWFTSLTFVRKVIGLNP